MRFLTAAAAISRHRQLPPHNRTAAANTPSAVGLRQRSTEKRRGVSAVEFSMVAIPMFILIFGLFEVSRVLMAQQAMEEAARSGCRVAVLRGATDLEMNEEISGIMQTAGITEYTVDTDPVNHTEEEQWAPISVTVTAHMDAISWLPSPTYIKDVSFSSTCTLPKEYNIED